jgi:hypothetical protein
MEEEEREKIGSLKREKEYLNLKVMSLPMVK